VRGANQPIWAYGFSFWINPIGLTPRQLHHRRIQIAIDKKTISAVPRGWNKWQQMIGGFFPSPVEGWACLKPGNDIRRRGRRPQAGKGASQRTRAFRERGRSGERGRRRTRQDQISRKGLRPGEIADHAIRTERRKLVSSAG
jgi:hypothetical protein